MRGAELLTTTEAAEIAAVAPSTIKRWADQGVLPVAWTAGGHRRVERVAIQRLLRARPGAGVPGDALSTAWIRCLVGGRRHEIDSQLLEARGRLGAWWRVADELAAALAELGLQWERGRVTIADEHVASDALARALGRVGDALPIRVDGPRCLLACAGEDEHTLGLSLAELCLRELGWAPLWLGRRTPVGEVLGLVGSGEVSLVALSASAVVRDARLLRALVREVGAACQARGVGLLLGGAGAWPAPPPFGVRMASFAALHGHLAQGKAVMR